MQIFIDTADIKEIQEAKSLGVLDGVTTNPSLVAKTGKTFDEIAKEITSLVDGPVSLEAVTLTHDSIMKEAEKLASIAPNVVVKIPLIEEGLKAIKSCSDRGIKTNCTLCFSANQAYLAAKAGATYISPFVGRHDDIGYPGMELIQQIRTIYDNYGYETKILVASIRNPIHVLDSLTIGADVATMPLSVIKQLAKHTLTDVGLQKFLQDWEKVPK